MELRLPELRCFPRRSFHWEGAHPDASRDQRRFPHRGFCWARLRTFAPKSKRLRTCIREKDCVSPLSPVRFS